MIDGKFVKSGGPELALKSEDKGYDWLEAWNSDEAMNAVGEYKYGFHDPENATIRFDNGLSEQVVRDISELKEEPEWMTEIRVKAYHHFMERPMPDWGNCNMLESIKFDDVTYFLRSSDKTEKNWTICLTTLRTPLID